jgi:hypothetical protein
MDGQYSFVICTLIAGGVTGGSAGVGLPPQAVTVDVRKISTHKIFVRILFAPCD